MKAGNIAFSVLRPKRTTVFDNMLDILIALLPAAVAGCVYFGFRAVLLLCCCVFTAVVTEWGVGKLLKVECHVTDLSAVVWGLLVGMCMPVAMPIPAAMVCVVAAIIIPHLMFGGYGCEIVNPAAFGAVLAAVAYPTLITKYTDAFTGFATEVTPLTAEAGTYTAKQLLFGAHSGAIGSVGSLFLMLGALYLFIRRVYSPVIPVITAGSAVLFSLIFSMDIAVELLGGGLLLGAIFMAPARTTSPANTTGQLAYGLVCGLIAVLIRKFSGAQEGIYLAVLAVNLLRPLFTAIPDFNIKEEPENEVA